MALDSVLFDMLDRESLRTGEQVRLACRDGQLAEQTAGLAPGYTQANLAILPQELAFNFLQFCQRNPKPCPLLDVTEPGDPAPRAFAPEADLRTDLPQYRVWENGELVDEPTEIAKYWRDDFVSFVIGCSFTFEAALLRAGVSVRHLELGVGVPMFRTNIQCEPAGPFHGPMVVSMRPLKPAAAIRAVQITSRYPDVHGAPVHLGLPRQIGVEDLANPDFGDAVPVHDDELPVFWACGTTPQSVAMAAKLPLMITHRPGCMFVTDVLDETLAVG